MKIKKLEFEYCECGCKAYSSDIGGFWMYWDMKYGGYSLHRGHGICAPFIHKYRSAGAATRRAQKELEKDLKELPNVD